MSALLVMARRRVRWRDRGPKDQTSGGRGGDLTELRSAAHGIRRRRAARQIWSTVARELRRRHELRRVGAVLQLARDPKGWLCARRVARRSAQRWCDLSTGRDEPTLRRSDGPTTRSGSREALRRRWVLLATGTMLQSTASREVSATVTAATPTTTDKGSTEEAERGSPRRR